MRSLTPKAQFIHATQDWTSPLWNAACITSIFGTAHRMPWLSMPLSAPQSTCSLLEAKDKKFFLFLSYLFRFHNKIYIIMPHAILVKAARACHLFKYKHVMINFLLYIYKSCFRPIPTEWSWAIQLPLSLIFHFERNTNTRHLHTTQSTNIIMCFNNCQSITCLHITKSNLCWFNIDVWFIH